MISFEKLTASASMLQYKIAYSGDAAPETYVRDNARLVAEMAPGALQLALSRPGMPDRSKLRVSAINENEEVSVALALDDTGYPALRTTFTGAKPRTVVLTLEFRAAQDKRGTRSL